MLRQSSVFKEAYKSYLRARKITHIYIDDEISTGIEPTSILSTQARMRIFNDLNCEFDKLKYKITLLTLIE